MIIPFVVPAVVSPQFTPMVKTRASLVLSVYQYFNFLYCSQSKDVVGINLTVIIKPFDIYLWLALILCSVLITAAGSLTITKNVTRMALISVAALFSQTAARESNRHLLIPLWLASCFVINNMYSGAVTSDLIAPVEQDIIKTVDDLASRKYRLVYSSQSNYVINMIKKMAGSQKETTSLRILIQSVVVLPNTSNYIEKLAFDSRVAVFAPYMATMTYWRTLTQTIKQAYERKKEVKFKRRCYLGRELTSTYSVPEVWIFRMKNPKLSSDLAHTFTRMESAGIHDYWMKVFFQLQVAQRAQDVNVFKSKTQAKVDDLVEPLTSTVNILPSSQPVLQNFIDRNNRNSNDMNFIPKLNGSSILIGTHGLVTQTMLSSISNARAADIYGFSGITQERNKTLIAIGKLVTEVAKLCNFTPLVSDLSDIHSGKVDKTSYSGLIIPFVVPKLVASHYTPLEKTGGSIFLSVYQYFNFVYCDINRDIQKIQLDLVLQPFDMLVWLFILIGSIIMSLMMGFTTNTGFQTGVFMTVAGIFSDVITLNNKSKLLLLWLLSSFILNNLYSGVLTSLLIAPVEPDVMRRVDDLVERNYHFVYTTAGYFKTILFMTKLMAADSPVNSSLRILAGSIEVRNTLPELINSLAFETQTVLFGPFLLIMMYWKFLTEKNEQEAKKSNTLKFKRFCHMGKELSSAYSIPEAWVFNMNHEGVKSSHFSHLFYRLDANGIHPYWMHFFYRIQGTKRAQDLNRFKSKTEPKEEVPVEPLGLHKGSVAVIFVLYVICVVICVLVFSTELVWKSSICRVEL
ncbi:unnamed protein product [Orchesella dallaii]|uniref:Uncharacterized protein n=1 Tax=Orchesella dallaii TaxID=48710 RepID=A0ABP1Q517_9HEXA